jgi:hypothetical protein
MPYERPGERYYPAAATKAVLHGAPCVEDGICGIAIKQQAAPFGTGLGAAVINQVQVGEDFVIDCKGIVEVAAIGGASKGELIYITDATNALGNAGGAGTHVFGKVVELAGERGTLTGNMRVNLDLKV